MSSIVRMLARARTQGAKRPTPTQSTCLYYDHDNEASKCVASPWRRGCTMRKITCEYSFSTRTYGDFQWNSHRRISTVFSVFSIRVR